MLEKYLNEIVYEEKNVVKTIYASRLSELEQILLGDLGKEKVNRITKASWEAIQYGNWYEQSLIHHLDHLNILEYPKKDEYGKYKQVSVVQGIVKGKIDAIIKLKGKRIIVEIKTKKYLPDEPEYAHLWQIAYYMAYEECDFGILHYADWNRNVKEFFVEKDSEFIKKVKSKVDKINELYNNNSTGFKTL